MTPTNPEKPCEHEDYDEETGAFAVVWPEDGRLVCRLCGQVFVGLESLQGASDDEDLALAYAARLQDLLWEAAKTIERLRWPEGKCPDCGARKPRDGLLEAHGNDCPTQRLLRRIGAALGEGEK